MIFPFSNSDNWITSESPFRSDGEITFPCADLFVKKGSAEQQKICDSEIIKYYHLNVLKVTSFQLMLNPFRFPNLPGVVLFLHLENSRHTPYEMSLIHCRRMEYERGNIL